MRMHHALLLLLALCAASAQARSLVEVTRAAGYTRFAAMLELLRIPIQDEDKAYGTLFVPSNRAIDLFLSNMQGMTFQQLLDRPVLVDEIVAYSFVPGVAITNSKAANEFISRDDNKPTLAATGDFESVLYLVRSNTTGLLRLRDVQGHYTSVLGQNPIMDGNVAVWGISDVLYSALFFDSANLALRFYREFSTAAEVRAVAVHKASTSAAIAAALGEGPQTFFVPINKAFGDNARSVAGASPSQLAKLFAYHVTSGLRTVPDDFENGAKFNTLLSGHRLQSYVNNKTTVVNVHTGQRMASPTVTLVPESGKPGKIVRANIFAGKDLLHGVDAVLKPSGFSLSAGAQAQRASGRHLLQRSRSGSRGATSTIAMSNTQSAIRAAAAGRIPTSYAARFGTQQARFAAANCVNCARWSRVI